MNFVGANMSQAHIQQRIISGARVAFDPRTTEEAHATRDMTNRKALEQPMRRAEWLDRQRNKDAA
jgi:hypothetical protein